MTDIRNFTKQALESLPVTTVQYEVKDSRTPGLIVRVNPGGKKTFMFFRRVSGRLLRVKIGYVHDISIEHARKKAISLNSQIIAGVNPNELLRGKRRELTFKQLFERYYKEHSLIRNKRPDDNNSTIRYHLLPKIGSMKLSDISKTKMREIHLKQGQDRGEQQANRVLNIARAIFNFGINNELFTGPNPCVGIRRFKTKSRDRFLSSDELKAFFDALEYEEELFRDYFMLLLFTGSRKSNMLAMKWKDVDFDLKRWRLSEEETKNDDVNIYQLSDSALEILQRRSIANKTSLSPSLYVFPGTGVDGYLNDPKKSFARIKKRMGTTDIRIHDLRRTLASYMAINNASLPIIGRALNHKSQASTAIYARLSCDPIRDAVNSATKLMAEKAHRKALIPNACINDYTSNVSFKYSCKA